MIGAPVRVNGRYSSRISSAARASVGADDDAIGLQEVLDGGALLQELGIADDAERVLRSPCAIAACTSSDVPAGTVLLSTMTL